jgi:hypothetical protein
VRIGPHDAALVHSDEYTTGRREWTLYWADGPRQWRLGGDIADPNELIHMARSIYCSYTPVGRTDPRSMRCGVEPGGYPVRNLLEIPDGRTFWALFPKTGLDLTMANATEPVFLAVYVGAYPGPLERNPLMSDVKRVQLPNTVDVCAILPDGSPIIYLDISLEGASLPPSIGDK